MSASKTPGSNSHPDDGASGASGTGATVLVLAGTGRYADPWHPFVDTAERIAQLLETDGYDVRFSTEVDASLAELDGVDLLVVAAGDPWRNGEVGFGAPEESVASLQAAVDRGIGLLAVHNAVSSLRDYPVWRQAVGADWIVDRTMHPDISDARVLVHPERHPLVEGLGDFTVFDERYSFLELDEGIVPLTEHEHDGVRHPLLWAREHGSARVVYSALGHDLRSFESPEHLQILRRAAAWLTESPRSV